MYSVQAQNKPKTDGNGTTLQIYTLHPKRAEIAILDNDRSVLALKLKPLIAEKAKQKEHERKMTSQKSDESHFPEIDTKKELAKVAGVSHDTLFAFFRIIMHLARAWIITELLP